MILTDEEAKATQEVAKATGKAIDAASGAGTMLVNGTVGRIAAATLGLIGGDWVQEQQQRNLARMQAKTARLLDGIASDRLSTPSPSVVKPLLEAAADEGREELQDLWAALLCNSMLDGGRKVRRDYFEALRHMEPVDALILKLVHCQPEEGGLEGMMQFRNQELLKFGVPQNDALIAITKLDKLGCVTLHPGQFWPRFLAPFGIGLIDACTVA